MIYCNGRRGRNQSGNHRLVQFQLQVDNVALTNASVAHLTLGTILVGSGWTKRFEAAVQQRQCPGGAAESHVRRIIPVDGRRRNGTRRRILDGRLRRYEVVVVVTARVAEASQSSGTVGILSVGTPHVTHGTGIAPTRSTKIMTSHIMLGNSIDHFIIATRLFGLLRFFQ